MKRGIKLLILIVLLAVIAVAAVLLVRKSRRDAFYATTEETTVPETALAQFADVQKINKIHWMIDNVDYSFYKEDDVWHVEGNPKMPINMEAFSPILNSACVITASREVDAENIDAYGLDKPTMLIDLWTETKEYHFVVGGMNPTGTGYYASASNGKYYVVDPSITDPFGILIIKLCADDTIPTLSNIRSCHIEAVDTELMITCEKGGDGSTVYTETLSKTELDPEKAEQAINEFQNHAFEGERVTYYAEDEDLEIYGLDKPLLTLTVTYAGKGGEDETFTLYLGKKCRDDEHKKYRYARINDSREVYYYEASVLDFYEDLSAETLKAE